MTIPDLIADIEPAAWDCTANDGGRYLIRAKERPPSWEIANPLYDQSALLTALSEQTSRAERAEAERDAAFAMSKCECGPDEACRNLSDLARRAEAAELRLKAYEEVDADLNAKFLKISDARLKQAIELLKPLAETAKEINPQLADDHIIGQPWPMPPVGHLRAAARFLQESNDADN